MLIIIIFKIFINYLSIVINIFINLPIIARIFKDLKKYICEQCINQKFDVQHVI